MPQEDRLPAAHQLPVHIYAPGCAQSMSFLQWAHYCRPAFYLQELVDIFSPFSQFLPT